VQGTSLPLVARWLKLSEKPRQLKKLEDFDIDLSNDIKSVTTEIELTSDMLAKGNRLMDLPFPGNTLVVLIKRGENYFVPTGKTVLKDKDKILIITDNQEALMETYEKLGVEIENA
jgi:cell volume regulation protein A